MYEVFQGFWDNRQCIRFHFSCLQPYWLCAYDNHWRKVAGALNLRYETGAKPTEWVWRSVNSPASAVAAGSWSIVRTHAGELQGGSDK